MLVKGKDGGRETNGYMKLRPKTRSGMTVDDYISWAFLGPWALGLLR